jgi:hypothetical protein
VDRRSTFDISPVLSVAGQSIAYLNALAGREREQRDRFVMCEMSIEKKTVGGSIFPSHQLQQLSPNECREPERE